MLLRYGYKPQKRVGMHWLMLYEQTEASAFMDRGDFLQALALDPRFRLSQRGCYALAH